MMEPETFRQAMGLNIAVELGPRGSPVPTRANRPLYIAVETRLTADEADQLRKCLLHIEKLVTKGVIWWDCEQLDPLRSSIRKIIGRIDDQQPPSDWGTNETNR